MAEPGGPRPAGPTSGGGPRDASTLLLVRGDEPELFMVQRTGRATFMANALVFPGGRLDATDCDPAWADLCAETPGAAAARLGLPPAEGAVALGLLVAAIRETFEEAGLLLARRSDAGAELVRLDDPLTAARFEAHRARLQSNAAEFLGILREEGLVLATDALTYLARWVTPEIEPKRFDTRFFAARAPAAQVGTHDAQETTASAWMSPSAALEAYAAGRIQLAPPTYRILLELAGLSGCEAVLGLRGGALPETHRPRFEADDGELTLLLPGDERHGGRLGARNRIVLRGERWVSEGRGF